MRVIPVWTLEMAARLPFLFREPCLFIVGNTDDSLEARLLEFLARVFPTENSFLNFVLFYGKFLTVLIGSL